MLGKIYNDQLNRYENHDKQVIVYYEVGTLNGYPTLKVFYDDGSSHYIDMAGGGITADPVDEFGHPIYGETLGFVGSTVNSSTNTLQTFEIVITADGSYELPTQGGADGSFIIGGTWGDGTMQLRYLISNIAVDYDNGSLTADGGFALRWASDFNQITLDGSTSPSLTAYAYY